MTGQWASSNRRATLPSDWRRIRARILRRDPTCQLRLDGCTNTSTEVDHIGSADDHREHMLRGVCHPCHAKRTQDQAQAAKPKRLRATEPHPGVRA